MSILVEDLHRVSARLGDLEAFDAKSILVTGAAGFLGYTLTHLFVSAIERGVDIRRVILLDSFLRGTPRWISELARRSRRVDIRAFDVARDDIAALALPEPPQYVLHMASIASPAYYRRYPVETIDGNVWGLRRLLDYAKGIPLQGLLFFSSSEIYGDPAADGIPTSEDYRGNVSCVGPRACYDEAKRFGETLCYVYAKEFGMPITIVRPFNNYGPGMRLDDGRAPADFARAVHGGEDIVIHSDGRPTRTFCYVADGVVGYLRALQYGRFDFFNIGADAPEISVRELAEVFRRVGERHVGYRGKVVHRAAEDPDYLSHNPSRRRPDISKAGRLLGFAPSVSLDEGVRRFLIHLRQENGT